MNDPLTAYYVIRLLATISFLIIIIIIGAACLYTYFEILLNLIIILAEKNIIKHYLKRKN